MLVVVGENGHCRTVPLARPPRSTTSLGLMDQAHCAFSTTTKQIANGSVKSWRGTLRRGAGIVTRATGTDMATAWGVRLERVGALREMQQQQSGRAERSSLTPPR
jgi:hypothetical protein